MLPPDLTPLVSLLLILLRLRAFGFLSAKALDVAERVTIVALFALNI